MGEKAVDDNDVEVCRIGADQVIRVSPPFEEMLAHVSKLVYDPAVRQAGCRWLQIQLRVGDVLAIEPDP